MDDTFVGRRPTVVSLALAAILFVTILTPNSAWAAKPDRTETELVFDLVDPVCGFPTEVFASGRVITLTFDDHVIEVYPGFETNHFNPETGISERMQISGPLRLTFNEDGSTTVVGTGPTLWLTHPITGEPGQWMTRGRFEYIFADGQRGPVDFRGVIIDKCASLL